MATPRPLLVLAMMMTIAGTSFAAHVNKKTSTPMTGSDAPRAICVPSVPCCIPAGDYDEDGVQDRLDQCDNTPMGCKVDEHGCSLDADGDGVCDGIDECLDTPKGEKVNKKGCSASQLAASNTPPPPPEPVHETPAPVTPPPAPTPPPSPVEKQLVESGRIVLRDVYFDTNKATLLETSEHALNEAGEALEKFPALKIEVQGHTDSRGTAAYNQRLSQARAESVRAYLLEHFHLEAGNLTAKGYGESELAVSPEQSADDYAANRRVVLNATNPEVLPHNVKLDETKH